MASPRFYLSVDWHRHGWDCVGAPLGGRLHVLVGRHSGRAVLIWPLVVHRHRAWQVARWLGAVSYRLFGPLRRMKWNRTGSELAGMPA